MIEYAPPVPRANILGVGISALNMGLAVHQIEEWISRREHHYVCLATVNGVIECQRDPGLKQTFNASGLTTPDGMPFVWLSRMQGFPYVARVYGPDLMLALCERSPEQGYRHFFYGGTEGVAQELAARLRSRFPGLQVAGVYTPPFGTPSPAQDAEIVRAINASNADIVWVGLSAAKQDRWMAEHIGRLSASVLIGVGAAFDFHSGRKRQAPVWMQHSGLEWLFRLIQEPRRLWRRYLVYNPIFVALVLLQIIGLKRYASPQSAEAYPVSYQGRPSSAE